MMSEDIILNEDGDFPLEDNVIQGVYLETPYGDSDQQHIGDIILSHKGAWKRNPTLGFGASQYLNAEVSQQTVDKLLKMEMTKEGYRVLNGTINPQAGGNGFEINSEFISPK